jgi:hypothetical protein
MKRTGMLFVVAFFLGTLGCLEPAPVIYRVSLGMTEQRLLEAVGPPLTSTTSEDGKTLEFQSWGKNLRGNPVHPRNWYVHLAQGKVDAYGWRDDKPALRPSLETQVQRGARP